MDIMQARPISPDTSNRMNPTLLFRIFIPALGILAGVQFWILTDLVVVGMGVGSGVGGFLLWFVKGLGRKAPTKKRFIGEVSETRVSSST